MKLIDTPASRNSDPITSHLAEEEINTTGTRASQQESVLKMVQLYPCSTSMELARTSGIDRYIIARRLPELASVELIVRGAPRKCVVSKRKAVTWSPTPVQEELF